MLLLLLLISTIASLLASSVLGVRLLRLAARTRELPELMIGSSFIISGVIGYVIMLAGSPGGGAVPLETAERLFSTGYALIGVGVCCIYVFIWRTFRVDAMWASVLALAGILAVVATSHDPLSALVTRGPLFWLGLIGRIGAGAWGACESLLWWSRMRRRLALGLADPVVANRFLLWGLANVTTSSIFLASTFTMPVQTGQPAAAAAMSASGVLVISSITFFTASVQWLAFFPPKRYLGWVCQGGVTADA